MLYSQRNRQNTAKLIYSIPPEIGILILRALEDYAPNYRGGFGRLMEQVGNALLKKIPGLYRSGYEAARISDDPVIEHFLHCSDAESFDFIELCFRQPSYDGGQAGVDAVNTVLSENDIGFQLTNYILHAVVQEESLQKAKVEYPRAIRLDRNIVQHQVIDPALHLLSDSRLHVANSEMLDAYASLRDQHFEDAITSAGSAFESLMKTICELKGWKYDAKDTCSKLVKILKDNSLFPPCYVSVFEAIGTIRNNLGDAHGRGPFGTTPLTREFAEHMIHTTSAHMLFLARRAGLA